MQEMCDGGLYVSECVICWLHDWWSVEECVKSVCQVTGRATFALVLSEIMHTLSMM